MTEGSLIRALGVTKRYGSVLALDRLSLQVPEGSVLGLLGPNGAGKTTFLRLLMGFLFPEEGTLDRGGLAPCQVGYLPDRTFYPPRLRVREYLSLSGRLSGLRGSALRGRVQELLAAMGLDEAAGTRLGGCSRGMLQRVGLAQALLGDPPLLLLDEPMLGLDPSGQKLMRDQVEALRLAGKTILLSSHNLSDVARVCTHVAVLSHGRLVLFGRLDALLPARPEVTIQTGPMPAGLPSAIRSLAPGVLVSENRIKLAGDAVERKADVLGLLLGAGVDIRELTEARATLEEVYLEATQG